MKNKMRIVSDKSKEIEKKKICKNCGMEIGYLPIDIKRGEYSDYTGDTDIFLFIECPNCKNNINI